MSVAEIILKQLGGNKFKAMTGAKNFVGSSNYLLFDIPNNLTTNKINKVRITLKENDTYNIEFFRYFPKKLELRTIKEIQNVHVEQMRDFFENETGLRTLL